MTGDDVWNFILGICLGIVIGCLIDFIGLEISNRKFCPTCGSTYSDAVYCERDGTLLKERGN